MSWHFREFHETPNQKEIQDRDFSNIFFSSYHGVNFTGSFQCCFCV